MSDTELENPFLDWLMDYRIPEEEGNMWWDMATSFGRTDGPPMLFEVDVYRYHEKKLSHAIPNREAVELVAEYSPIVEMGAGRGYWADLVEQLGGDVICYDWEEQEDPFHEIHIGEPDVLTEHSDRTLLLIYPPYVEHEGASMSEECLDYYEGDTIIYIGEWGGCTGTPEFHQRLQWDWEEVDGYRLPQRVGVKDYIHVLKRND